MKYLDDPRLSWSAVGLLAYLDHAMNMTRRLTSVEPLSLIRGAYVWHPDDAGDLGAAIDQCLALGYLVERDGGYDVHYGDV